MDTIDMSEVINLFKEDNVEKIASEFCYEETGTVMSELHPEDQEQYIQPISFALQYLRKQVADLIFERLG